MQPHKNDDDYDLNYRYRVLPVLQKSPPGRTQKGSFWASQDMQIPARQRPGLPWQRGRWMVVFRLWARIS
jgi:hypothetical protein